MTGVMKVAKYVGAGLAVTIFLWVCGQLGYRYLGYCRYLTSPAACLGKVTCWGAVFGTLIGTTLLGGFLWLMRVKNVGYLIACTAAFLLIATFRLTHLVSIFCS